MCGQKRNFDQQVTILACVGAVCMLSILGLFASAFTVAPTHEVSVDCVAPVASESWQLLITFIMGFLSCFIMKRRHDFAGHISRIVSVARRFVASVCSSASSLASTVAFHYRRRQEWFVSHGDQISAFVSTLGMAMVGVMCTGVVIGLFVSAFTAVPDEEPADSGFASETSTTMKAFTLGWMFMLSLKLRRELVGVVGSSCFLQPC